MGICVICHRAPQKEPPVIAGTGPSPKMQVQREIVGKSHDGQKRGDLHVKEGGFHVGAFAATNPGKLSEYYNVDKKVVGEGGFGSVVKGKDKRTGQIRAVKMILKKACDPEELQKEIDIMRVLDHPNIVRLQETFEDKRYIYLVMELCEGGELFDRIVESKHFTEHLAAICARQMLLALNYMHQNLIMHRDLKPENFLLVTKGPIEQTPLKLIDFGISRRFKIGEGVKTKAGTPMYIAPEVIAGKYDEKVDIWALGVITYIMLAGVPPFSGSNPNKVLEAVKRAAPSFDGAVWKSVSAGAKDLIKSMLMKNPKIRPGASQALSNDWVASAMDQGAAEIQFGVEQLGGLKSYSQMNQLKKAALNVIAMQFPDGKIEKLKQMFLNMDDNGDGTLSVPELKHGLVQAGIQVPAELEELLLACDTDGSGAIDYTEFLASTLDKKLYHQESVLWSAFQKFDLDNSGCISKTELSAILGHTDVQEAMNLDTKGGKSVDEIFREVDVNGDGTIDFDEFVAMMKNVSNDVNGAAAPQEQHTAVRGTRRKALPGMRKFEVNPTAGAPKADEVPWWEAEMAAKRSPRGSPPSSPKSPSGKKKNAAPKSPKSSPRGKAPKAGAKEDRGDRLAAGAAAVAADDPGRKESGRRPKSPSGRSPRKKSPRP